MKKYYSAGATRVAMRTGAGTGTDGLTFLFGDHLGSNSVNANSAGVKTSEIRYRAWGEDRYTSGSTPTDFRFTGQRVDSYINLIWMNSRWYDPALGRFTSPDSIVPGVGEGGNPNAVGYLGAATYSPLTVDYHESQFLNQLNLENRSRLQDPTLRLPPVPTNPIAFDRYAYSLNSPVRYTDPSGHMIDDGCGHGECGGANSDMSDPSQREAFKESVNRYYLEKAKVWQDNNSTFWAPDNEYRYEKKYQTFTFGTTIPNPITGTALGWHASITQDQYGNEYFGHGFDLGKSLWGGNASFTSGYIPRYNLPDNPLEESEYIESFLTGDSFQIFVVPVVYLGGNFSSNGGGAFESGLGTPQIGGGWTHTWKGEIDR